MVKLSIFLILISTSHLFAQEGEENFEVRNFEGITLEKEIRLQKNKDNTKGQLFQSVMDTDILWFRPEMEAFARGDKHLVSFAGLTRPISYFTIKPEDFYRIVKIKKTADKGKKEAEKTDNKNDTKNAKTKNSDKEFYQLRKKDVKHVPGYVDKRGIFLFKLYLPKGEYQMTLALTEANPNVERKIKYFTVKFFVKDDEVGFIGQEGPRIEPPNYNYYSVGLGLNYSAIKKESTVPLELRYNSIEIPSLRIGYSRAFKEGLWRLDTSFLAAPGKTKNGTKVEVDDGSYYWMRLHVDGIYSKKDWLKNWRGYQVKWGLRGGLQLHQLPFLETIDNSSTKQKIGLSSFQTLDIGGHVELLTSSPFHYSAYMSLSIPGVAASDINISSPFTFHGSLGAHYKKNEKWSYGLFWYGQWLSFSFSEQDQYINDTANGDFSIIFSNLEFRAMYKF